MSAHRSERDYIDRTIEVGLEDGRRAVVMQEDGFWQFVKEISDDA